MPDQSSYPLWDWATRLFHWLLVAAIPAAWWTAEEGHMEWHGWIGYSVLLLLLFRLCWGWLGSRASRFASFVRGPATVAAYLRGNAAAGEGHNPLGGWSVLLMLVLLLSQVVSGLFNGDDILFDGPLRHLVSSEWQDAFGVVHEVCFNLLLGMIALHLASVLFYQFARGDRLIQAMIRGRAVGRAGSAPPVPWWRAPVVVVLLGGLLWAAFALVPAPVSYW
ncbi:cytochrome b/b6 domain-containing protein [Parahaliea aestuarii]|uniref:Hydrogenase n=1 Tax=Parahaliea aestuarii TaxID=1852021 RepID=A0A5C8ZUF7_9GAMM|nr:cytochrome b/b6 domain-containing protein [Parahaliea aestuarii]TXS90901.1 hydrogenase [Parahaliea aestuarii]